MSVKNFAGVAALIGALIAAPGVVINTYFDYHERKNQLLVQKSTYTTTIGAVEDLGKELAVLRSQVAELRGYVKATAELRVHTTSRRPAVVEEVVKEMAEVPEPVKPRKLPSFNDIQQHVQSTGFPLEPQPIPVQPE